MASVIGKRVNGRTYYYLAESARVAGEPRIVSQRYLGTAEDIGRSLRGSAAAPRHSRHLAFGDVAAVWAMLDRLGVVRVVDEAVGARQAKVSVGTYLALAVLHRATSPNAGFAQWWVNTAADRFVRPRVPAAALEGGRCWRVMQRLTANHIEQIEAAVCGAVGQWLGSDTAALALDLPNFATFVASDTAQPHARGNEARPAGSEATLAGLGVVVTRDGAIPLMSRVYRRNHDGVASFGELADQLAARHRALTVGGEVTVVFDAGQHAQLDLRSGRHFVGALQLGDYPELLARPSSARRAVDPERFTGVSALESRATVFGVDRRVVLTHSTTLHAGQARAFAHALSTATRQLDGLAGALAAGTYRPSRDQLLTEVARITRVRRVDRVLHTTVTVTDPKPGEFRLVWRIDEVARTRLNEEFFGKQLLVTDHDDWSVADVITAYRARYHLDSTFRQLNDPFVAGPSPRWHWTDDRIAVHALVCVLAATVTHLMRREADQAGLNMSVRELMEQLSEIGETVLSYPSTGGRPRVHRLLTDRDATQQQLFDLFGLSAYAPRE